MDSHKKKILVADDDMGIVDAITLLLEEAGYEVEATADGATLRHWQQAYPDLLLLDIWMSGWNGRDICSYLKGKEHTKHIPVIIISANKDAEKIAQEAGADDFLAKPFDMDELLEKIARHL